MTAVPVLETERLILRGLEGKDFEPFVAFFASPVSRFVGGPLDRVETWRRLCTYAGGWAMRGYGQFALESKADRRTVGLVGPWFPEGWPEAEIGWTLLPEYHGKGLAFEAARRALQFAYETLGWRTAVSCMNPDNRPSIRLAERMGATFEGRTEIRPYGEALLYRHRPPQDHAKGNAHG